MSELMFMFTSLTMISFMIKCEPDRLSRFNESVDCSGYNRLHSIAWRISWYEKCGKVRSWDSPIMFKYISLIYSNLLVFVRSLNLISSSSNQHFILKKCPPVSTPVGSVVWFRSPNIQKSGVFRPNRKCRTRISQKMCVLFVRRDRVGLLMVNYRTLY